MRKNKGCFNCGVILKKENLDPKMTVTIDDGMREVETSLICKDCAKELRGNFWGKK